MIDSNIFSLVKSMLSHTTFDNNSGKTLHSLQQSLTVVE